MDGEQTAALPDTHHSQLGLSEGGFIRNNVVLLMEGVKQEELVPLGAPAHQSPGLWRKHRGRRVTKAK